MKLRKKILIINDCAHCKHFDSGYDGEAQECRLLWRDIEASDIDEEFECYYKIPDDCPLPDVEGE
jgi:hypothetical protein